MIVNAREKVVAGSVDYLLGRERNREAQRASGNPKKSGTYRCHAICEETRPVFCRSRRRRAAGRTEKMASFCVLMPGLEKIQHPVGGAPGQGTA